MPRYSETWETLSDSDVVPLSTCPNPNRSANQAYRRSRRASRGSNERIGLRWISSSEDASMFPRQVEQDSALGQLKKAFVHPGCEAQVHERVPGEAIAQDRAAEEPCRQRDFAKITQEVVERHGPRVQMQQPGVSAQIHDDVIMVAHPDGRGEPRKSKEAEDPEGDDPRRTHPHDSRLDPAPSKPIHEPPRDRRLPRTVRPHDRINPRGPRAYRPRSGDAVVRPRVEGLHGKPSIQIRAVPQNRAGRWTPNCGAAQHSASQRDPRTSPGPKRKDYRPRARSFRSSWTE